MKLINSILRFSVKLFFALIAVYVLLINFQLYYQPDFEIESETSVQYNRDVYHQLKFLKEELRNGAGEEMQSIYPEGFIFINSLYALAWADFLSEFFDRDTIFEEGVSEISWVIDEITADKSKDIFPENLPLKFGVFYRGWTNYVLGRKLKLQKPENRNIAEIETYKRNCDAIYQALKGNRNPYLESYQANKWPADGIVAVSSLSLHDHIFHSNSYKPFLSDWLDKVKNRLDPETGLIPHSVNPNNDETSEGARGSSQSLILIFLKEIDPEFAKEQFQLYEKLFLDWRMGLPGIREYPKGKLGFGDIDSGPVIWGIGGAASIVGQKTMGLYDNWSIYSGLRNSIESFGLGYETGKKKKYLFGMLPMVDAFIAWSNATETTKQPKFKKGFIPFKFHLISLIFLLLIALLAYKI